MTIYPAIDLMEGRAVRLRQGDPSRRTEFGADPVAVARLWVERGAGWLHVIDLDGALAGSPRHLDLIQRLCGTVPVPVQVGGGLRAMTDLDAVFRAGAARAILGTAALEHEFLTAALDRFGERIAVALDARDGLVAIHGWRDTTSVSLTDAAMRLAETGASRFIYTSVARDGMMGGPDLAGLAALRDAVAVPLIVSGGIASIADVTAAARAGAEGVIIGRALYDGRVALEDVLRAVEAHADAR